LPWIKQQSQQKTLRPLRRKARRRERKVLIDSWGGGCLAQKRDCKRQRRSYCSFKLGTRSLFLSPSEERDKKGELNSGKPKMASWKPLTRSLPTHLQRHGTKHKCPGNWQVRGQEHKGKERQVGTKKNKRKTRGENRHSGEIGKSLPINDLGTKKP